MKKIGIITFHRAINYGAVLQAYALCSFLNSMGFETSVLDYRNSFFEEVYHSTKLSISSQSKKYSIKYMIRRLLERPIAKNLENKFNSFLKLYIELSQTFDRKTLLEQNSEYNYFITGSDQVWNLDATNGDMSYFLDFADPTKRISFAASLGGFKLTQECVDEIKKYKSVSVRENLTNEQLKIYGIVSEIHMDPVFLIEKKEWLKISDDYGIKKPYVLLFSMGKNKELCRAAKEYADDNNLDLFYLSNNIGRCYLKGVKHIFDASPSNFISLFYNARYIFTNSFHGTAFSILFEKQFYCHLTGTASDDRMMNLLSYFNLLDYKEIRLIGKLEEYNIQEKILENKNKVQKFFERID